MNKQTPPPLTGPARAFAAAVLMFCPDVAPSDVAWSLAGTVVRPVHRAFAQHMLCNYFADSADPIAFPDQVRVLREEAAQFLEVVRRDGLEAEAWRAMTYLVESNGLTVRYGSVA